MSGWCETLTATAVPAPHSTPLPDSEAAASVAPRMRPPHRDCFPQINTTFAENDLQNWQKKKTQVGTSTTDQLIKRALTFARHQIDNCQQLTPLPFPYQQEQLDTVSQE